ncbi:MAG: homoserine dehydrogenase [Dehalococcoidia bacterium]|nr:MAG: homoserine dehydrogenase [Dehalococcoidia bacterium]
MKRAIGIGLLGLGVVGSGVAEVLVSKADKLAEQVGALLVLKKVLVRDVNKQRMAKLKPHVLTGNLAEVLSDPEIDIVIEVVGGEHPATEYIRQAITKGKHVVTANKEAMAKHGYELLSLAEKNNVGLRYEASVGSGIPLIATFQQDLASNDISAIYGILNGTTNYILTQMAQQGLDFPLALRQAQELGYAEPDPANDVEGIDAAYKLAILSSLAFHAQFDPQDISCQGISGLAAQDFRYAREFGYAIKLLAIAKRDKDTVEMRVHPVFLPEDSQLAKVDGVYNAIQVEGDLAGTLVLYGEGAGALRASSAIVADVLTISKNIYRGVSNVLEVQLNQKLAIKPMLNLETRYYFRLNAVDRPGVLAQISKVLGDNSVSISSVIQKESDPLARTAELVIMTHSAKEEAVQKALGELRQLAVVNEVVSFVRVEG